VFGLSVPIAVPEVPPEVLVPRDTWSDGALYDAQAKKLAGMFRDNFNKFGGASEAIRNAGPKG
jgi:phosphoenolpyruvate carboxykinase (ATP)